MLSEQSSDSVILKKFQKTWKASTFTFTSTAVISTGAVGSLFFKNTKNLI